MLPLHGEHGRTGARGHGRTADVQRRLHRPLTRVDTLRIRVTTPEPGQTSPGKLASQKVADKVHFTVPVSDRLTGLRERTVRLTVLKSAQFSCDLVLPGSLKYLGN